MTKSQDKTTTTTTTKGKKNKQSTVNAYIDIKAFHTH